MEQDDAWPVDMARSRTNHWACREAKGTAVTYEDVSPLYGLEEDAD